jgi:simple sugar transport system ATP-binding protein
MTAVSATGVTKHFGSVAALDHVDFQAEFGVVQAVVGENGAGKTTLMRILHGEIGADAGEIQIEGGRTAIGMVSQHYAIIPELTCLENLMLGAEPSRVLDHKKAASRADDLADQMGFSFAWHEPAEKLSPAGAQKLEILKLLWRRSKIMILDEPTSMLSPADADSLYASLKKLAEEGACVIVVTHRLPEVMAHCRRVTVLRGGKVVAATEVAETNSHDLAELIVGHALERSPSKPVDAGAVLLEARGLQVKGYRGNLAVQDANFEIHAGEVVGIAGVDGSGQRELFHAILGTQTIAGGSLAVLGEGGDSVAGRLKRGLRIIPEDRHEEGLIEAWSLTDNAVLGLQREPRFARSGFVNSYARRNFALEAANRFSTKFGSLAQEARSLSGGNQQRLVAGRTLASKPRLILAFQPARGLDIAGVDAVYGAIKSQCREDGAAALVVSFDLDELLEHCDRILVMSRGRMVLPPPGMERDRAAIGRLMVEAA